MLTLGSEAPALHRQPRHALTFTLSALSSLVLMSSLDGRVEREESCLLIPVYLFPVVAAQAATVGVVLHGGSRLSMSQMQLGVPAGTPQSL